MNVFLLWEGHPAAWDCPGLPVSDLVVPAGSDGGGRQDSHTGGPHPIERATFVLMSGPRPIERATYLYVVLHITRALIEEGHIHAKYTPPHPWEELCGDQL